MQVAWRHPTAGCGVILPWDLAKALEHICIFGCVVLSLVCHHVELETNPRDLMAGLPSKDIYRFFTTISPCLMCRLSRLTKVKLHWKGSVIHPWPLSE